MKLKINDADAIFRLENSDAPEVKEFIEKQIELADEVLAKCDTREKLKKKVTALYNYPRYGCPTKRGKYCFYNHNTGLQSQAVLYKQVIAGRSIYGASCITPNLAVPLFELLAATRCEF